MTLGVLLESVYSDHIYSISCDVITTMIYHMQHAAIDSSHCQAGLRTFTPWSPDNLVVQVFYLWVCDPDDLQLPYPAAEFFFIR